MITVYYNGKPYQYADSTKYLELARTLQPQFEHDIVLASVNGKLQELWKYIKDHDIRLFHHLPEALPGFRWIASQWKKSHRYG